MNQRKFGFIGEKIAQGYLKDVGYKIIDTNFYSKKGEIDIIMREDNIIIFVEVKTRTNFKFGTPASAINKEKKLHIKKTAKIFLQINKLTNFNIRFDVVEVIFQNGKCKVNHIKNIM